MGKTEIQKEQVIGWAVVIRRARDISYKCLEPIVLSVDEVGVCCIDAKANRLYGDIAGILPAAPDTYRVTTLMEGVPVVLGISHPGDGIPDSLWMEDASQYFDQSAHLVDEGTLS